jgi:hypothetical protein
MSNVIPFKGPTQGPATATSLSSTAIKVRADDLFFGLMYFTCLDPDPELARACYDALRGALSLEPGQTYLDLSQDLHEIWGELPPLAVRVGGFSLAAEVERETYEADGWA